MPRRHRRPARTWGLPGALHLAAVSAVLLLATLLLLKFAGGSQRRTLIDISNLARGSALLFATLHLHAVVLGHLRRGKRQLWPAVLTALLSAFLTTRLFSVRGGPVLVLAAGVFFVSLITLYLQARPFWRGHAYDLRGLSRLEERRP